MAITATNPVSSAAVPAVNYNSWFITQMIVKNTPTSCPTIITLQRAAQATDGSWTLMPINSPNATVTFKVDVVAQASAYPSFASAMTAIEEAVVAYATAKNLL